MSYPSLATATNNAVDRTHRSNRLRAAGFPHHLAWRMSANHDAADARIATTAEEMTGWQIRIIGC